MDPLFLVALANIVLIDIVLSGDNAIVIAMAVKRLPAHLARRAAILGAVGAVTLRVLFTAGAAVLLTVPLLQAAGGATLLAIAGKLVRGEEAGDEDAPGQITGFWEAVKLIVLADVVMSLDNVLAVGGAAHGSFALLAFGLALSIPLVLVGSGLVSKALARYPLLNLVGAAVIAGTACRMIVEDPVVHAAMAAHGLLQIAAIVPWVGVALLAAYASRPVHIGPNSR